MKYFGALIHLGELGKLKWPSGRCGRKCLRWALGFL